MPRYRRQPLRLERSALLVLDMQRFFLEESSHAFLPAAPAILPNVNRLLALYEALRLTVVLTYHAAGEGEDPGAMGRWWKDVLREGDPLAGLWPLLRRPPSALVSRKDRYDAFHGTSLDEVLRGREVEQVLICGVMTHLCCETTARSAFVRDFEVFLVADATATLNEELHVATLRAAAHGFAMPLLTEEVLRAAL